MTKRTRKTAQTSTLHELQLLSLLLEYMSLYLDQIQEMVSGSCDQNLRMKLQRLRNDGLVHITIVPTLGVQHAVYSLSKKGKRYLLIRVDEMKSFVSDLEKTEVPNG